MAARQQVVFTVPLITSATASGECSPEMAREHVSQVLDAAAALEGSARFPDVIETAMGVTISPDGSEITIEAEIAVATVTEQHAVGRARSFLEASLELVGADTSPDPDPAAWTRQIEQGEISNYLVAAV